MYLELQFAYGILIGTSKNVHEGPMGIGTRVQYTEVPLSPGNVISNGTFRLPSFSIYL